MPPKKKKKLNEIKDKMSGIIKIFLESEVLIKEINLKNKIKNLINEYLEEMTNDDLNSFLEKLINFINENEAIYKSINMHSKIMLCCIESIIFLCRKHITFLSKKIMIKESNDVNPKTNLINNIFDELTICLQKDIYFYNKILILDEDTKDVIKYNLVKEIINTTTCVIKNIVDLNEVKTLDDLINIKNIINDKIINKKFNKVTTPINTWSVIIKNINYYITSIKPFDIYKINQRFEPLEITEELIKILNKEKNKYSIKLNIFNKNLDEYTKEFEKIKQTFKYKNDDTYNYNSNFILKRNNHLVFSVIKILNYNIKELNRVENDYTVMKTINDPIKQLDILYSLNNFLLDNHKKINEENITLDLNFLQNKLTCKDHLNLFSTEINWIEICQSIKNYYFFKNSKTLYKVEKYKTIKCSLKSIIKDENLIKQLNDEVLKVNEIVTRTYLFIKQYTLYLRENKQALMDVTDFDFISMSMRTICINDKKGANMSDVNKKLLEKLGKFYDEEFSKIYTEKCNAVGLSQILNFTKMQMTTAYTNNIVMNYQKYLKSYLISMFLEKNKKEYEKIKDKNTRKAYVKNIANKVMVSISDIFCGRVSGTFGDMKSEEEYKELVITNKDKFLPSNIDFSEKGLLNDLEKNPTRYFEKMINMCTELEKNNKRLFACFPLRTSLVPSNIDLDTMSLITLFITPKNEDENNEKQGISKLLKDNIIIFRDRIWSTLVDLNRKQFKWNKNYEFDHHIQTDGINATILFAHKDMKGIELRQQKDCNKDVYKYVDKMGMVEGINDETLMKEEITKMCEKYTILLLDPGKNPDLLFMCNYDENRKNIKYMKYTTKQRIHEMQTIKNRNTLKKYKKEKNMGEIEKKLSEISNKTCDYEKFKKYMKTKSEVDIILKPLYEKEFIRKLKLRSYINKLRSESKLVNNIKNKFKENKKEIIIMYGDWSRTTQMRGIISTPCIGIKRRLSEDFKIMDINEFRTSCLDNKTLDKNFNAKVTTKNGKVKNLHAVLVSTISKTHNGNTIKRFQNRDRNSVLNMVNIIEYYKKNGKRHPNFDRQDESSKERYANPKKSTKINNINRPVSACLEGQNSIILKCNTRGLKVKSSPIPNETWN